MEFQQLSALELKYLEKELQILVDAKVDKIYMLDKKDVFFRFHKSGVGKLQLRLFIPNLLYLTNKSFNFPSSPPGYCIFLRKYLTNSRLRNIKQIGSERILNFQFETKKDVFNKKTETTLINLFVEFFDKGNIIFTDENLMIKSPLENQNWSQRTIRGGVKYEYPKKDYNIFELSFEEFKDLLLKKDSSLPIIKFLTSLGLGKYSLELLKKAKISENKNLLSEEETERLYNSFKKFITQDPNPCLYNDKVYFFKTSECKSGQTFETISLAFDSMTQSFIKKSNVKKKVESKSDKIKKIIAAQTKRLNSLEKEMELEQKKGELIYQNYALVDDILKQINAARKTLSWKEIKSKLKDHKIIKKIDEKSGTIEIELNES